MSAVGPKDASGDSFFPTSFSSFDNKFLDAWELIPVMGLSVPALEMNLIVNDFIPDNDNSKIRRALKSFRAHSIVQTIAGVFFACKPDLLIKLQSWLPIRPADYMLGTPSAIMFVATGIICVKMSSHFLSQTRLLRVKVLSPSPDLSNGHAGSASSNSDNVVEQKRGLPVTTNSSSVLSQQREGSQLRKRTEYQSELDLYN